MYREKTDNKRFKKNENDTDSVNNSDLAAGAKTRARSHSGSSNSYNDHKPMEKMRDQREMETIELSAKVDSHHETNHTLE